MTSYIGLPLTGASPYWGNAVDSASSLPAQGEVNGQVVFVIDTASLYYWDQGGGTWNEFINGLADVSGPASSTDNAFARFSGITGKVIKNSAVTADDSGNILTAGDVEGGSLTTPGPLAAATATIGTLSGVVSATGGVLSATAITASRAVASDAGGIPVASATTAVELGYLSGVTSAIQTQINTKVTGPASAVDNTLPRYDLTTGKLIKTSGVTVDNSDNVDTPARINAATAKLGATGAAATSALLELSSTTGALLLTRLTTAQRDALTATAGMIIFNDETSRFQGYFSGAWADLHGWGS